MKKVFLILLVMAASVFSVFASPVHHISLGEEGESVIYYNDSELIFMLPYEKKMMKLDRKLLAYDKDGFLKLTFNGRQVLIIEGQRISQFFSKFRSDGRNLYDRNSASEDSTGYDGYSYSYNVKSVSASSYLKEDQYGQDIVYAPINLFRAFLAGCKCHPYWWNDAHIPWVEGVKGNGINESISVEFKSEIHGFSILNGYADVQNMKLYKENSRVKRLKVEDLTNKLEYFMDFEDKVYFNYLSLSKPSKLLKLTILDVYKGTKYQDTCISAMIYDTDGLSAASNDWITKSFETDKARCSYSDDITSFEKYFEYISQPAGNSSIYEKNVKKAKNLFSQDSYWYKDYGRLDISEDSGDRYGNLIFELGSHRYSSVNADMYIDEYGYKHLKLFDENMKFEHHFTILDTYTAKVSDSENPWDFEPNHFRYAFFEHTTEFLKDDKNSVKKYFVKPSENLQNGAYTKNIKASSYLKEGKTSYAPENTTGIYKVLWNSYDSVNTWSNQTKPWVEGKKDDGIGETFEFDMAYSARLNWDIRILNGYVDPLKPHLFKENNRIKKALLETDTGIKKEVEFRDEAEFTQIILPTDVKHVKFTIREVYKGTKYRDTCITSIEINEKYSER